MERHKEELVRIIRENTRPAAKSEEKPACIIHNLYLTITVQAGEQIETIVEKVRSVLGR